MFFCDEFVDCQSIEMIIGVIFQILLLDQVLKKNIEEGSTSVSMKSFISKHPQIELLLTFYCVSLKLTAVEIYVLY